MCECFSLFSCAFSGNIPAGDVSKGETVVDYLQPFPARGLGSQRMIFILYKQEGLVDFTAYKKKSPWWVTQRLLFEPVSVNSRAHFLAAKKNINAFIKYNSKNMNTTA